MTAVAPDPSFAAKAQALVPALVTAASIGMVWQMFTMNHAIGALEANTATLIEMARDHGSQLRSLNDRMAAVDTRMTGIEAHLQELTVSIGKLVPK